VASVLVMGAGGVGSYYGALLARAGHDVCLVARGPHLRALRSSGEIAVQEPDGSLWHRPVAAEAAPTGPPPDLAIVTTKSHHTLDAARALAPAVGPNTLMLSLQNGVENVARIDSVLGPGRCLAGQAFVGVWVERPGTVVHGAEGHVSIGDPAGGITPRARQAHALLESAWDVSLAQDIVRDQWRKLLWNAGFNALCAITGCTAGEALADPAGAPGGRGAVSEGGAVAEANGITLTRDDVEEMAEDKPSLRDYRPSTARDLEAGKPVERDALCGFLSREGARHGLDTPVNDLLDALLGLSERAARR
jgi:2-dehydropantoate 2-reductase